jgi:hypothetical protein
MGVKKRSALLAGSAVLAVLSGLTAACVGGEWTEEESGSPGDPYRAASRAGPDTVSPVPYQVFDHTVESEDPRKMMFRLVTMTEAGPDALSKTLRLALDSLGRADTTLVAARAVIYTFRPTTPRRGELVPGYWGEWTPPEGWEEASGDSRGRVYRTFVYNGDPGWGGNRESASERQPGS